MRPRVRKLLSLNAAARALVPDSSRPSGTVGYLGHSGRDELLRSLMDHQPIPAGVRQLLCVAPPAPLLGDRCEDPWTSYC